MGVKGIWYLSMEDSNTTDCVGFFTFSKVSNHSVFFIDSGSMKSWAKHWIVDINLKPLDWQSSFGKTNLWQLQRIGKFPNGHCQGPLNLATRLFLVLFFIKMNPFSLKDLLLVVVSKSRALRVPFVTNWTLFFSIASSKCHTKKLNQGIQEWTN